jgi:CubicO group peptidase (beta-lactamase class C family)
VIALVLLLQVIPGGIWEAKSSEDAGLSRPKLDALRDRVGGRGCVVHRGFLVYSWGDVSKTADVASAGQPVITTLMLLAVQDGRLKGVNDPLSRIEPRLTGKNAGITWRHLASQTSGYGLAEEPGAAYATNGYAWALYYDTLMEKVYGEPGTAVLKRKLGEVLGFQDEVTLGALGAKDRPGRLEISVRDFARFGLLALRGGQWGGKQVVDAPLLYMSISTPIATEQPLTEGRGGPMIPGQRTLEGTRDLTKLGPGVYSFTWWLNRSDSRGQLLFVDAPPETFVASGHGGGCALWVVPSLDLVVSWNDSRIDDQDRSPGNSDSLNNRAARLMVEAVGP